MPPILDNPISTRDEKPLRLFVAVPLWEDFLERNRDRLSLLEKLPADFRWVQPENWHITLKFLGPVPEKQVPGLVRSLEDSLQGFEPFSFEVGGLGGFPRLSKCRVLWVGVTEGKNELNGLADRVADSCRQAGFPGDKKPFQAHLTLARSRKEPVRVRIPEAQFKMEWGRVRVDGVSLIRSTLGPGGPKYETIQTLRF